MEEEKDKYKILIKLFEIIDKNTKSLKFLFNEMVSYFRVFLIEFVEGSKAEKIFWEKWLIMKRIY